MSQPTSQRSGRQRTGPRRRAWVFGARVFVAHLRSGGVEPDTPEPWRHTALAELGSDHPELRYFAAAGLYQVGGRAWKQGYRSTLALVARQDCQRARPRIVGRARHGSRSTCGDGPERDDVADRATALRARRRQRQVAWRERRFGTATWAFPSELRQRTRTVPLGQRYSGTGRTPMNRFSSGGLPLWLLRVFDEVVDQEHRVVVLVDGACPGLVGAVDVERERAIVGQRVSAGVGEVGVVAAGRFQAKRAPTR